MFLVVNTNTADDILPKLIELLFKKFKARREVHPLLVCNTLKKEGISSIFHTSSSNNNKNN
jgi:hypothetical protein